MEIKNELLAPMENNHEYGNMRVTKFSKDTLSGNLRVSNSDLTRNILCNTYNMFSYKVFKSLRLISKIAN